MKKKVYSSTISAAKSLKGASVRFVISITAIVAGLCGLLLWLYHLDQGRNTLIKISGATMGTHYHVSIVGVKGELKKISWQNIIDEELLRINKIMSTYDEDSELSKLNRQKTSTHKISPELGEVIATARKISTQSKGYYDITVLPVVELWGFGKKLMHPDLSKNISSQTSYLSFLQKQNITVGNHKFDLKHLTLIKHDVNVELDLSSIAKGYGVDKLGQLLEKNKVNNYMVEIGGEVLAKGKNLQQQVWRIGIETPAEEEQLSEGSLTSGVIKIILLDNQALATSGDYRNFKKIGDRKYGHTISPFSLMPEENDIASVTVVAGNCMLADAWATAFKSMGSSRAKLLAEELKMAVYIITYKISTDKSDKDSGSGISFSEYVSPRLKALSN